MDYKEKLKSVGTFEELFDLRDKLLTEEKNSVQLENQKQTSIMSESVRM